MRKFIIVAGLFVLPAFARAQAPQQPQNPPGFETTMLSYRQLGLGIDALVKEKVSEVNTLRQHINDLESYLKACGDKPGCTVPVGVEPK
jgi:hypothetical protein